jgi:quinol monooxygenase YgiN
MMIRHVVVFRCTGGDLSMRMANAQEVQRQLESLRDRITELRHLEVGLSDRRTDSHWDAVLVTDFDSTDDLDAYQAHPDHQAVIAALDPLVQDRAIVDYSRAEESR